MPFLLERLVYVLSPLQSEELECVNRRLTDLVVRSELGEPVDEKLQLLCLLVLWRKGDKLVVRDELERARAAEGIEEAVLDAVSVAR